MCWLAGISSYFAVGHPVGAASASTLRNGVPMPAGTRRGAGILRKHSLFRGCEQQHMSKQTYFFPLGLGVDAEVTIEAHDGSVGPEHVQVLGRYLMLYFEAMGGEVLSQPLQIPEPKRKYGRPVCKTCGEHARAKVHTRGECQYEPAGATQYVPLWPNNGDGQSAHVGGDEKRLIETQEGAAKALDKVLASPRRPYVNQRGVLCVDIEHSAVEYDLQEGRYKVQHPAPAGAEDAGHVHVFVTGRDTNLAHETLATCTDTECARTIMVVEEVSPSKEAKEGNEE